ncbi:MAG: hypothetical protein CVV24_00395 [Ignavibacteriae bacterium HGW-Ignavibacteriae-3]|nr:MAG: hypothetical protein CVV24_00395 [Ignavibacteriae bacterium HGW-Ignavibacteriae-3]
MSFFKQIFLPLVIIAICVILLYSSYEDVRKETIHQLNNEHVTHARQAATGIKLFFEDYNILLNFMAKQNSIINLTGDGKSLIEAFYKSHTPEIKAITRIDENGRIIHTVPYDPKFIGADISYQTHIKKFLSSRSYVLSDVFDAVQGYRSIAYYVPVFKNGLFKGGIAVLIPFEELSKNYLGNIKVRETGAAWTISQSGAIIYSPFPEYNNKNIFDLFKNSPSMNLMLKNATAGKTGSDFYSWVNPGIHTAEEEENVYITYYPIRAADQYWSIIISTPEREIVGTMRVFMNKWFIIVFLLILGTSIYLYYILKARAVLKEEMKRKKAEEALRQSEQKFKTLFQAAGDAILLHELDGRIIEVNNYAIDLLGYTRKEFLKLTNFELNLPVNSEQVIERRKLLEERGELYFETIYRTKNGSHIPVSISKRLIDYDDRKVALSIIRDISAKKKEEEDLIHAKEEAEKASRLKSEFLAQMSHEIRSPLNVVVGFTQLLRDELQGTIPEDISESFKGIDTAGQRIIRTVEMILNMSELQTGMYESTRVYFDLVEDSLRKIYSEYEIAARKKGLLISLSVKASDTHLYADLFSTGQIFVNLLDNAIKYTHTGDILITVDRDDKDNLTVSIADTGIGISEEYLPKLFDPFTQEEQGYSRKYEGSGLGMALVKRYCQINNIDIEVDSAKGVGTKYLLHFSNNSGSSKHSFNKMDL